MVRRHTVALSAVAMLALVLGGCSRLPAAFTSDQSDYAAAARVWQDPWVAPLTQNSVAGPGFGTNGWVNRSVGGRTTDYDGSVRSVAKDELTIAKSAGWSPTSSRCGEEISIALAGPADALASLVVAPSEGGSTASVDAVTPHHLDDDWSVPDVVRQTCLDGKPSESGAPDYAVPPGGSEPLRSSAVPDQDEVDWHEDELSRTEASLLAEVSADLTERGLPAVPTPTLSTGMNQRSGGAMQMDLDRTTLTELSATLDGWDLTFTACGGGGPIRVTFVRSFEHGPAVASATLFRGTNTLTVRLPVPEGPPPPAVDDLPPLAASPCFDGKVDHLTVLGIPAVLPAELTPIRN